MMKYCLIGILLSMKIIGHQCPPCLDGYPMTACNTCTNGLCVCPGYSRNGFPCTANSDVE